MPETREITVYTFDELSDKAKERALQEHAQNGMHYGWWEGVYIEAKEQGKERGFEIDDIRFSGFSSQGDGASWTGRVRVGKYLDWKLSDMKPDDPRFGSWTILREIVENQHIIATIEVSRGGGMYVHENTMRCEVDAGDYGSCAMEDYDPGATLTTGVLAGAALCELLKAYDFDVVINGVIKDSFNDAKDYAREIYKMLEKEYDWLTSEDYFQITATANEWRFDDEGNLV